MHILKYLLDPEDFQFRIYPWHINSYLYCYSVKTKISHLFKRSSIDITYATNIWGLFWGRTLLEKMFLSN